MIRSGVPINPTAVCIHGVTGRRLTLLGESIIPVRFQRECTSIRFLVSDGDSSILGLNVMCALGNSVSLQATSSSTSDWPTIQRLIVRCCNNKGGMAVDPAMLEVDGVSKATSAAVWPMGTCLEGDE